MSDRGLVFIVDYDESSADVLQDLLEKEGYGVVRAAAGKDALGAISLAEPNLVLLDAHLPDVNPFAFLEDLISTRHESSSTHRPATSTSSVP